MIRCTYEGCNYTTRRIDNYNTYHLPGHTGEYKYRCDKAGSNGCTFRSTRADRLKRHKLGGKKSCPKL